MFKQSTVAIVINQVHDLQKRGSNPMTSEASMSLAVRHSHYCMSSVHVLRKCMIIRYLDP